MAETGGQRGAIGLPGTIRPGTLTALLQEIAAAPQEARDGAWEAALRPGATVGRFELVRELGRGGFGVVWEARDRELGRLVAFKVVKAGCRTGVREERLLREAEAAALLSHPNIVTLYDVGRSEHGPYLVLELLHGETLEQRLEHGRVSVPEALRIAKEVAKGLAHAHSNGVVHRDLTPGNVFLCNDGQVKVLDLGMAHAFGRRKADGGTPAHMAPEQMAGAPEDERTDVFALGVMLFEMLSGKLPFPEAKALASSTPAPLLETPEAPALGRLVGRMLAKEPVKRPRDGGSVQEELSTIREALARAGPSPAPVRVRRRPPKLAFMGLLAALFGAAIAAALALHLREPVGAVPSPAADGRVVVAVADFANETGDPELDGLERILIGWLEQSRRLRVLTRGRMSDVLREMGKGSVDRIDEPLAREVGRRAGVRVLLLASIRQLGASYAVEVRAVDPEKDDYLFALPEQAAAKGDLFALFERLSDRVRERIRERPAEVVASKVRVDPVTKSFEAWHRYFRGLKEEDAYHDAEAVDEHRMAVAADPAFALAHYRIAYLGENTGVPASERAQAIEAALRNIGSLPAKERMLVEAWKAHVDGQDDEAHRRYAQAVEAFPQDKEVLYQAGDLYYHRLYYKHGNACDEALPLFRRAAALDPTWGAARAHLFECLYALNLADEALALARAWVERSPSGLGFTKLSWALSLAGRLDEAVAAGRRATEMDDRQFARNAWSAALVLADRYGEAEAVLRAARSRDADQIIRLAGALAYQGRRREAFEAVVTIQNPGLRDWQRLMLNYCVSCRAASGEIRRLLRSVDPKGPFRDFLPLHLLFHGEAGAAAELAASNPESEGKRRYLALLAWRHGEKQRALAEWATMSLRGTPWSRVGGLWLLIVAAREEGRDADLVASVESLVRTYCPELFRAAIYPESLLWAAEAHERLGEREKARAGVEKLLGFWTNADPDLPLLAEAKALCRRLGCRVP